MHRLRALFFLFVTLCFVACLCAAADDTGRNENQTKAEEAVKKVQGLAETLLQKAENKLNQAEGEEAAVEAQKTKAELAASQVASAAAAEKDNGEIKLIAENAEKHLQECLKLHEDAKKKAENVSKHVNELLVKTRALKNKTKKQILLSDGESTNYTTVIINTSVLINETQKLSEEFDNASSFIELAESAFFNLKNCAEKIQVDKYQADSIVIVYQINTMIKAAESDIQTIQQKKDKVNTTVQHMKKNIETPSHSSNGMLPSLYGNAESQLQTASKKLTEANNSYTNMLQKQTQAHEDHTAVKIATKADEAMKEFKKVEHHANLVKADLEKIKEALYSANISVKSAETVHQQMLKEISQSNSKSQNDSNKGNEKYGVNAEDVTTSFQNGDAVKTAISNTEKSMHKDSEQSILVNVDSTEKHESPQLMYNNNNSELINNPLLRNITKNVTQNSLTGENVSKWEAENDSEKTISISLLVAFIVSAVLH